MNDTAYSKLRSVNVSERVEKKNGFSYLSWPFAVDTLLTHDQSATWAYGAPQIFGDTMMVSCAVTAFGKTMCAQLPVMNHMNKAIANPDAFAVNTAMQRCLVKAIALHGLGLYLYAGEDLPAGPDLQTDPRGDLGKHTDPKEADTLASTMADLLNSDLEEDVKALKIADIHDQIRTSADLYVAASDKLSSRERSSWKAYVRMAAEAAKREPVLPNGRARL